MPTPDKKITAMSTPDKKLTITAELMVHLLYGLRKRHPEKTFQISQDVDDEISLNIVAVEDVPDAEIDEILREKGYSKED